MTYTNKASLSDRFFEYETQKRELQEAGLSDAEYEAEIRKLAERLGI